MEIINSNLKFNSNMNYGNNPKEIILHHASANGCSVESIHQAHKNNGWAGIGYHYYVRKDGKIYKGREDNVIGSHCSGHNSNTIGICAEGDYENVDKTMPEVQKKALKELVSYLKNKYGISKVSKHKDYNNTDCPGQYFPLQKIKNAEIEKEDDELMNVKEVFCEAWYLQAYADVKESGMNAYEHYTKYGKKEGRKPNVGIPADWNEAYYLLNNPDVNRNVSSGEGYQSGLHHYLVNGWKEKRSWKKPLENEEKTEKADTFYRVVTGSYKGRENAEEKLEELKNAGFDSFLAIYEKEV